MSCWSLVAVKAVAPKPSSSQHWQAFLQDQPGWYHTALHSVPARAKHQLNPLSSPVSLSKKKLIFLLFLSYLKTRGRKPFSKWLNGGRLVVFDEIRHRVVNSVVSIKQKLPWFALVDHKVSTPISASATRKHSSLKRFYNHWSLFMWDPLINILDWDRLIWLEFSRLTCKTECNRWIYCWGGSGNIPTLFHAVFFQHPWRRRKGH